MTPEEHSADKMEQNLSAINQTNLKIEENTKAVERLRDSIKDPQPEKVVKKLEEIKSASLITNKHLKEIRDKEAPQTMKVELEGVSVITIKGDKGDKGERGEKGESIKGDKGERGEKGDMGERGPTGKTGPRGEKGDSIRGERGVDGRDGKDGADGKDVDEKKITKEVIKEVIKKLPDLTQDTMNQVGYVSGGGMGDPATKFFVLDLSSQLNGSTKTFTITQNRILLDIASSSFPWTFRPTVDYTISGESRETLTFTSEITAATTLAAGQTLIVTGIRP